MGGESWKSLDCVQITLNSCFSYPSPADSRLDLDLRCIENALTDYDSQHLQTSESG